MRSDGRLRSTKRTEAAVTRWSGPASRVPLPVIDTVPVSATSLARSASLRLEFWLATPTGRFASET
jgi:hypothetical protein